MTNIAFWVKHASLYVACLAFALNSNAARLNDTGLTACVSSNGKSVTTKCSNLQQDAASGRDTVNSSDKNGIAGFSFEKLDSFGHTLPKTSSQAVCILDKISGLAWELKSEDVASIHYKDRTFTNTFGDPLTSDTDTFGFIAKLNSEAFCGRTDWRIPSMVEAITLTSYALKDGIQGGLDLQFFNDRGRDYWTTTCDGNCLMTPFNDGTTVSRYVFDRYPAIAVSGKPLVPDSKRFKVMDNEAVDSLSGVTWQRCPEGMELIGEVCVGTPISLDWSSALRLARQKSLDTGKTWRLPNIKELTSIGHRPGGADPEVFPNAGALVTWSSTFRTSVEWIWASVFGSFPAYGVNRSDLAAVRLVRDSE